MSSITLKRFNPSSVAENISASWSVICSVIVKRIKKAFSRSSANLGCWLACIKDFLKSSSFCYTLRLSTYFLVIFEIFEVSEAFLWMLSSIDSIISLTMKPHSAFTSRLSELCALIMQRLIAAPIAFAWIVSGTTSLRSALKMSFLIASTPIFTSWFCRCLSFSTTAFLSELKPKNTESS